MIEAISQWISLTVALAWIVFLAIVIHDFAEHQAKMTELGKQCAAFAGQPYVGKSCQEIASEQRGKP